MDHVCPRDHRGFLSVEEQQVRCEEREKVPRVDVFASDSERASIYDGLWDI